MLSKNQKRKLRKQTRTQIKGKGDYSMSQLTNDVKNILRSTVKSALIGGGGAAGSTLATSLGLPVSAGLGVGRELGAKISRLIGSGDYTIGNPTAVNALIKGAGSASGDVNASFGSTSDGVRIRHLEFIQDVTTGSSSGIFNNVAIPLNPGLAQIMPYLASIAQNFEEYRFNGIVFEFVSTTSPYNSSSAMGSVVMAMEYNPLAPAFNNKQSMENSDFAVSARFDKNMMYGVECREFTQNAYLTRYQSATPLNAYDSGLFQIATAPSSSFPTSSVVGELWVSYDVSLLRPRISPARFGFAHVTVTGTGTAGTSWGTMTFVVNSAIGTLSGLNASSSSNLPTINISNAINGDLYMINAVVRTSANQSFGALYISVGSGSLTPANLLSGHTQSYNAQISASSEYSNCSTNFYTVTASTGGNVNFWYVNTGAPTGAYTLDIVITDVGNGFTTSTL